MTRIWEKKKNECYKNWTDNNIGDSGAKMISESLKINTTLTELDLYRDDERERER